MESNLVKDENPYGSTWKKKCVQWTKRNESPILLPLKYLMANGPSAEKVGQFSGRKSADDTLVVRTLSVGYKSGLFIYINAHK